jgi:phospholipase C
MTDRDEGAHAPGDGTPALGAGRDGAGAEATGARHPITRRRFMQGAGAIVGTGAAIGGLSSRSGRLIERALELSDGVKGSLNDIEHFVILMQENRSFDHYFGTMSAVRGFSDKNVRKQVVGGKTYPIWDQFGWQPGVGPNPNEYLQPFHLVSNPPTYLGEATNDITHSWVPQHQSWNNGKMDSFLSAHLAADGTSNGVLTMGYFTEADLAFHFALCNAFTVCDHYFCSVLGPTDPNRLMFMSGSIDPTGVAGGPIVETMTSTRFSTYNTCSWKTMPENLQAAGVSWKVYADGIGLAALSSLEYFKAYNGTSSSAQQLANLAFSQTYPGQFQADVTANALPAVSWIIPPVWGCDHPAAPPEYGEYVVQQILNTLVGNPEVWAKTAFIIVYDENGGWFDHVPPPTAPAGTEGEYLTANPLPAAAGGIAGPIGLGFRVPCMVVSPFSRGGFLSSQVFDHTSTLRLLEKRFGVPAPNISVWRRATCGDLTSAFDFVNPPNTTVPKLPTTSITDPTILEEFILNTLNGTEDKGTIYPPPVKNVMPVQAKTPLRPAVP